MIYNKRKVVKDRCGAEFYVLLSPNNGGGLNHRQSSIGWLYTVVDPYYDLVLEDGLVRHHNGLLQLLFLVAALVYDPKDDIPKKKSCKRPLWCRIILFSKHK